MQQLEDVEKQLPGKISDHISPKEYFYNTINRLLIDCKYFIIIILILD
jgi:hypothetical protein